MNGISSLFRFLVLLYKFSREANTFVGQSSSLLQDTDPQQAAFMRRWYRIIMWSIVFTVLICVAAVPVAVPWIAQQIYGFKVQDALTCMLFGVVLSLLPLGILYIYAGVSIGCLFAPTQFMESPVGQKWRELIGTRSVAAARVVCSLVVLAALVSVTIVAALQVHLAQDGR